MTTGPFSVTGLRVALVGAGDSGVAAAELLVSRGAIVRLCDASPAVPAAAQALTMAGVRLEFGPHEATQFSDADLIVVSPGVPPDIAPLAEARRRAIPIIGEVELASRWLRGRVIAVTGTKGKSTTTTLIARMLAAGGLTALAGGNLGTPLSRQVEASTSGTYHVVEVSSFQLETIETFHPWVAVLVNLSPDHLDRHASFEEYARAKARIFENQTAEDFAVVNADDPASQALAAPGRAARFDFALEAPVPAGVVLDGEAIVALREGHREALLPRAAVRLQGRHLLADVLAAAAVATLAGVRPSAIQAAVESFTGLPHALELVKERGGVRFVNDSKATNVVSVRRSIESFDRDVVPIMGGRYKGGAFEDLRDVVAARVSGIVAIGEAAPLVRAAYADLVPVVMAASMQDAVTQAARMARPGGAVVLAPGCSSFDMFANYRERGQAFKDAVQALADAGSAPA